MHFVQACLSGPRDMVRKVLEPWGLRLYPEANLALVIGMGALSRFLSIGWQQSRWTPGWRDTTLFYLAPALPQADRWQGACDC